MLFGLGVWVGFRLTFGCGFGVIIWLVSYLVWAGECVFCRFVVCLFGGDLMMCIIVIGCYVGNAVCLLVTYVGCGVCVCL